VPEPDRDGSGYRRYDAATLVRLARVRRLRELGLSLAEIEPLLRGGDGGAALRDQLRELDAELAEQARRLRGRRALIAGLLREGVDDPIAVSAADVWEEYGIAWLRRVLPDVTPEEEFSERRFQRAVSALMPPTAELPPPVPPPDLDPVLQRRAGLAQRRFHALASAPADDPRIEGLIGEMTAVMGELLVAIGMAASTAPAEEDVDEELVGLAVAAALQTLPPAQRRVLETVMPALIAQAAEAAP
jgi:DNA-binding transcriptional MerR regulator